MKGKENLFRSLQGSPSFKTLCWLNPSRAFHKKSWVFSSSSHSWETHFSWANNQVFLIEYLEIKSDVMGIVLTTIKDAISMWNHLYWLLKQLPRQKLVANPRYYQNLSQYQVNCIALEVKKLTKVCKRNDWNRLLKTTTIAPYELICQSRPLNL